MTADKHPEGSSGSVSPVPLDTLEPSAIGTVLRASTAHVAESTMALLTRLGRHEAGDRYGETVRTHRDRWLPRIVAHEYGAFVMVEADEDLDQALARMQELHMDGLPELYRLAVALRASLIELDADNEQIDGLATFDW